MSSSPRPATAERRRDNELLGVLMGVLVVALALAGCISQPQDAAVEAALEQQRDIGTEDWTSDLTQPQRICFERGAEARNFDEAAAIRPGFEGDKARTELLRIALTCVDDLENNDGFVNNFIASLNGVDDTYDVDEGEGSCLISYIVETADDPAEVIVMGGSADAADVYATGFERCFDPASLAAIRGESTEGPSAYGDDAGLDSLYDDCEAGDDRACDLLWWNAQFDTAYKDLAFDCAGRGTRDSYCTDGVDSDEEGLPVIQLGLRSKLTTDCTTGDMTACDLLGAFAPLGSDAEAFGSSCGERIVGFAVPDCRTRFTDLEPAAETD